MKDNFIKIKELILLIETKFSVNNWKINDINIWAFVRIPLFFYVIRPNKGSNFNEKYKKPTFLDKVVFKLKHCFKLPFITFNQFYNLICYKIWLKNLTQKEFLFVGHNHHRVDFLGVRYNRFYDPLIEQYNLQGKFATLEYWAENENSCSTQKQSINYEKGKKYYEKAAPIMCKLGLINQNAIVEKEGFDDLLAFLDQNEISKGFADSYNNLAQRFDAISVYEDFFSEILKKIKPKNIFILCYYSDEIMTLIAIANKLNINTIEMQHGPVAANHLAYSSWSKLPQNGYDCLPRQYWCWDEGSKANIDNWAINTKLYSAFVGGNPWLNYWQQKETNFKFSGFILYSLQPIASLDILFPQNILNFIKNNKMQWLLRLHPRQLEDKTAIENYLKKNNVFDLVNIEDATNEMLPVLLKNTLIHITRSSGVALEAASYNKTTVLIDDVGKLYYPELIESGLAIYINPNDVNFEINFLEVIQKLENVSSNPTSNRNNIVVNQIFSN